MQVMLHHPEDLDQLHQYSHQQHHDRRPSLNAGYGHAVRRMKQWPTMEMRVEIGFSKEQA